MERPTVVSAGYMPLDIVHYDGRTIARSVGGTAGNVAAILAYLGWTSYLAGQSGTDLAGDEFDGDLVRAGVNARFVERNSHIPTVRLVHSIGHNRHAYLFRCPSCGSRFPRSRPLTLAMARRIAEEVPDPTVFFFDRANPATVWLAETYFGRNCTVLFEPSVSPAEAVLFRRALAASSIVKYSADYGSDLDALVPLEKQRIQIVTYGVHGSELYLGGHRPSQLPAFPTVTVDTAGAGDWTTAGFLDRYAAIAARSPESLLDALRFGQALAAVNCSVVGARGAMQLSRSTVLRRANGILEGVAMVANPRRKGAVLPFAPDGMCQSCLMPSSVEAGLAL